MQPDTTSVRIKRLGLLGLLLAAIAAGWVAMPALASAQAAGPQGKALVLILVRHADKAAQPADDPPLTPAGAQRAQDLVATLRNAGVSSIVTTQLRRTRDTAQPLATALGLTPQVLPVGERALVPNPPANAQFPPDILQARADYVKSLVAALRSRSGVVLVVGHDWSVPGLIAALGGPKLPNICASVYDNLFVLTVAGQRSNVIQAHYGAATPESACK